ncbi:MAG TPA: IS1595 family transposase [Stellaceae bacterium]|nr:IS1595 family transposase [Stellaceae bacterium]
MTAALDNPAFQDDGLAREWFEARIWPNGPVCPHCGAFGEGVTRLCGEGGEKGTKHRAGCFQCNACRKQFSVTVGTVMERSKIPLHIWLKAMYLLATSKKGMSTHQLHRMLGVSLKSTWFLMHRIREAAREPYLGTLMGGRGQPVQADETFVGRTTTRAGEVRKRGYAAKEPIITLVDGKQARSFHVPEVNGATLKPILREQISPAAMVFTDEATYYRGIAADFPAGHFTVQHNIGEYVRGGATVNACENYFSILKRGIYGTYQHVSPTHLKRYVAEFDFRFNNRVGLGINDMERTEKLARGAVGKRLTYQRTRGQSEAEAS